MTAEGRSQSDLYTRFDVVVRHDGRSKEDLWRLIEDALCGPDHRTSPAAAECRIGWMSSHTSTLEEVMDRD